MGTAQNFITESGERYTWTAEQAEAYRQARAAGVEEREAIEAGHGGAQQARVPGREDEGLANATAIYAHRTRVYEAAARGELVAPQATEQPVSALPDPTDVYARRERIYEAAAQGRPA